MKMFVFIFSLQASPFIFYFVCALLGFGINAHARGRLVGRSDINALRSRETSSDVVVQPYFPWDFIHSHNVLSAWSVRYHLNYVLL